MVKMLKLIKKLKMELLLVLKNVRVVIMEQV